MRWKFPKPVDHFSIVVKNIPLAIKKIRPEVRSWNLLVFVLVSTTWCSPEHQPSKANSPLRALTTSNLPVNSLNSRARARLGLLILAMPGQWVTTILANLKLIQKITHFHLLLELLYFRCYTNASLIFDTIVCWQLHSAYRKITLINSLMSWMVCKFKFDSSQ